MLYRLNTIAQSSVANRLGYKFVFNEKHPSMHYRLDTANPEHMEVAQKIVEYAVQNKFLQGLHNMFLDKRLLRNNLVEDHSLWYV